jgi:hypothetical protein
MGEACAYCVHVCVSARTHVCVCVCVCVYVCRYLPRVFEELSEFVHGHLCIPRRPTEHALSKGEVKQWRASPKVQEKRCAPRRDTREGA